ncbi:hypothetical protein [Phytohabitans rumicis]|uniref:DUF1772 domain-containing protein n=1 Tax=Phytohabitans rumicis TaxID=1076125 RepID=A0A6V8LGI5_9ACTN|nr:hypothetical protein [Phytohabitans rumicis]GFJ96353.1 hypothetical protein Prum_099950 [Phytohabitans rumicis]
MLTGTVLFAATMTTGLMAGVFFIYANAYMPGLGRTDDRTFVGAFQATDRAIINPLFMGLFFGSLVLIGLAALLYLGKAPCPGSSWRSCCIWSRSASPWPSTCR